MIATSHMSEAEHIQMYAEFVAWLCATAARHASIAILAERNRDEAGE
jgi:hypothetical protein